jgi:hypothetical protein
MANKKPRDPKKPVARPPTPPTRPPAPAPTRIPFATFVRRPWPASLLTKGPKEGAR